MAVPPRGLRPLCSLRIITINDVYQMTHLPRFASCVAAHRTPTTAVTCQGDFLGPSLLAAVDKGRAMVDVLNRVGIQYACLGNHEARVSPAEFRRRHAESRFVWINSNIPALNVDGQLPMPDYVTVDVPGAGAHRKVALLGINTNDLRCFPKRPFGGAAIADPCATAADYAARLRGLVDCVVPLTHLDMKVDRQIAMMDLGFPIILGGHDHDFYHEVVNDQHILKLGMDAKYIGIVDLDWLPDRPQPVVSVAIHDALAYPPDPEVEQRVEDHHALLRGLAEARLTSFPVGVPMSSVAIRSRPSPLAAFLCTAARDALHADCCLVTATSIRGEYDYPASHSYFSYADLLRECPISCPMVVVSLPGSVLQDAVVYCRTQKVHTATFLHFDRGLTYDEIARCVTHVRGRPFDPTAAYAVALPYAVLPLKPIKEYTKLHPEVLPAGEESAVPLQVLLVEYWSSAVWLQLAKFHDLDVDGDGTISADELRTGLARLYPEGGVSGIIFDNVLACADTDGDGQISRDEFLHVTLRCADLDLDPDHAPDAAAPSSAVTLAGFGALVETLLGEAPPPDQLKALFEEIDADGSGAITSLEARQWLTRRRAAAIGVTGEKGSVDLLR